MKKRREKGRGRGGEEGERLNDYIPAALQPTYTKAAG